MLWTVELFYTIVKFYYYFFTFILFFIFFEVCVSAACISLQYLNKLSVNLPNSSMRFEMQFDKQV